MLLAKRQGDIRELDAGRESFATFTGTWWRLYGDDKLSPKTKVMYRDLLKRHLTPPLGAHELRQIDTLLVSPLQAEMLGNGVGRETTRKTLTLLQGILERAVEWGRIRTNPVRSVRKPSQRRQRNVQPIPPSTVEALRRHLLDAGKLRDATLVSVLAYAGLRPGEALALMWTDIGKRTISVSKSISFGEESETKTGKARVVSLLKPLAADLEEWRKATGRPNADALVFPGSSGGPWLDHDWRNWRKRVYAEAAKAVGIESPRPYDLRHSLASLMCVEHRNPLEIAQMLGHSPDVLFRTYASVMPELLGARRQSATTLIEKARRS